MKSVHVCFLLKSWRNLIYSNEAYRSEGNKFVQLKFWNFLKREHTVSHHKITLLQRVQLFTSRSTGVSPYCTKILGPFCTKWSDCISIKRSKQSMILRMWCFTILKIIFTTAYGAVSLLNCIKSWYKCLPFPNFLQLLAFDSALFLSCIIFMFFMSTILHSKSGKEVSSSHSLSFQTENE